MSIDVLYATGDIVSAYVHGNQVSPHELPQVIASVRATLARLTEVPREEPARLVPPVPLRKSITPEFIVCLEDGRRMKTLKRHLALLGLTPDEYRRKWGLPSDYPMTAPSYSAHRSELAKEAGLGKRPQARRGRRRR